MNRRRGQKSVTGLAVLDALNGFTADQGQDGPDDAGGLALGHIDVVRGGQAEDGHAREYRRAAGFMRRKCITILTCRRPG